MKKFIKKSTLFILFFLFFYCTSLLFWGSTYKLNKNSNLKYKLGSYGHLNSRVKDLLNFESIDILFLGSSHAYRGFDPRIFKKNGISSFNLGSSSQTPIQTEILLQRYLKRLNPKMVIYEVFPGTFSSDGVESALDIIANDKLDSLTLNMAFKLNSIIVYNTLIYKMIRSLIGFDKDFIEPLINDKSKDKYISGGFVEKELAYNKNIDNYSLKIWDFYDYQIDAFEQTISLLQKQNIKVILVQAPITSELYISYSNNSEIDHYFSSISEYYNFNDIVKLSSTQHFYDDHHLNTYGVKIFNEKLISILTKKNYFITKK